MKELQKWFVDDISEPSPFRTICRIKQICNSIASTAVGTPTMRWLSEDSFSFQGCSFSVPDVVKFVGGAVKKLESMFAEDVLMSVSIDASGNQSYPVRVLNTCLFVDQH